MADALSDISAREQSTPITPRQAMRPLMKICFALLLATAMWWLVWETVEPRHQRLQAMLLPAMIVSAMGLFILRTELRWARPARSLRRLLGEARAGEAAIEELSTVSGGLKPIVEEIQDLLRELRQQKVAVAELNEEVRLRVATRTNALERQIGSLRQQATRDPLTGLFNRRMLEQCLPKLIERCHAEQIDLSVLMIDIDHFKPLNDTLGHGAGDELLRDIGHIIRSSVRDQDASFRIGGDEFVVLLPSAAATVAQRIAQRMIDLVDGLAKPLRLPQPPRLSVGIASLRQLGRPTAEELLSEADRQLYEVKAERHRDARPPLARSA